MTHKQLVRQRATERRRYERVGGMKAENWKRINVRGINPYTIDRVTGTYTVEFHHRTGKTLPYTEHRDVEVTAYDLRLPDGKTIRFATLGEAKAKATQLLEGR